MGISIFSVVYCRGPVIHYITEEWRDLCSLRGLGKLGICRFKTTEKVV